MSLFYLSASNVPCKTNTKSFKKCISTVINFFHDKIYFSFVQYYNFLYVILQQVLATNVIFS